MKKVFYLLIALVSITTIAQAQAKKKSSGRLLRHVVLFKFKDSSSVADIKKVEEAFRGLPLKIKQIKSFEWGINNSPEELNQGFTHCFTLGFSSVKDRAIYLPHPAHVAFGTTLQPILDKVLVIDYWAKK